MSPQILWKEFDLNMSVVDILSAFRDEKYLFLLESSLYDPKKGRYSFIGCDPFAVVESRAQDHLNKLRKKYERYCFPEKSGMLERTPFPAGIMGFFGYEYGYYLEKKIFCSDKSAPINNDIFMKDIPDSCFGFYDCVLTIDHKKRKVYLSSTGLPETKAGARNRRARERLEYFAAKLSSVRSVKVKARSSVAADRSKIKTDVLQSDFTKRQYTGAVKKALEYIRLGDIYQVNLAQRFYLRNKILQNADPVLLYALLRDLSPSCFASYFNGGKYAVISSSPERFLQVRGREVETMPMKGTRPRGNTQGQDVLKKKELIKSAKDKAELLMITDLERNDLGRVCESGSVKVEALRTLEEYRTVFQATSTIKGRLRKDKDVFDLIRAGFPGGSITGCPKIRSMEIIRELEKCPRSLYTGSLGYISFSGNMDLNILIRTLLMNKEEISFHVGGGIVADSDPEQEYEETLVKAKAMQECLRIASQGVES